jgi:hypothetical protein
VLPTTPPAPHCFRSRTRHCQSSSSRHTHHLECPLRPFALHREKACAPLIYISPAPSLPAEPDRPRSICPPTYPRTSQQPASQPACCFFVPPRPAATTEYIPANLPSAIYHHLTYLLAPEHTTGYQPQTGVISTCHFCPVRWLLVLHSQLLALRTGPTHERSRLRISFPRRFSPHDPDRTITRASLPTVVACLYCTAQRAPAPGQHLLLLYCCCCCCCSLCRHYPLSTVHCSQPRACRTRL